jgi:hypothetical protein
VFWLPVVIQRLFSLDFSLRFPHYLSSEVAVLRVPTAVVLDLLHFLPDESKVTDAEIHTLTDGSRVDKMGLLGGSHTPRVIFTGILLHVDSSL